MQFTIVAAEQRPGNDEGSEAGVVMQKSRKASTYTTTGRSFLRVLWREQDPDGHKQEAFNFPTLITAATEVRCSKM